MLQEKSCEGDGNGARRGSQVVYSSSVKVYISRGTSLSNLRAVKDRKWTTLFSYSRSAQESLLLFFSRKYRERDTFINVISISFSVSHSFSAKRHVRKWPFCVCPVLMTSRHNLPTIIAIVWTSPRRNHREAEP